MKQTAVEWLVEQMNWDFCYDSTQKIIEQAKAMEKEQQIKFAEFVASYPNKNKNANGEMLHAKSKYDGAERTIDLFEQYYNETYTTEDDSPEPNEALKSAKEKYDEWDATLMDGIEYESWDELYDDYVGEADLHEFVQWLKDNFQVPNKLGPQNP